MVEFNTENIDLNSEYGNFINQKKTESKDTVQVPKFTNETTFDEFLEYTKKQNFYHWIGTTIKKIDSEHQVGYEVKIEGGSRPKRIPMIIIFQNKPIICKIVDSYKDIESGLLNLTDTNDLIRNAGFDSANIVIIPIETEKSIVDKRTTIMIENLRKEHEFTLISLEKLWNTSKINLSGKYVDLQKILLN
tara:strand:+ start:60 stop:629 length:570 start_codon:yes stop_codon:yes gene_type:complete